jgi:hypothetical protein
MRLGVGCFGSGSGVGPPESPTTLPQDGPPAPHEAPALNVAGEPQDERQDGPHGAGACLTADADDGSWLSPALEGAAPPPDEDATGAFTEGVTCGII